MSTSLTGGKQNTGQRPVISRVTIILQSGTTQTILYPLKNSYND